MRGGVTSSGLANKNIFMKHLCKGCGANAAVLVLDLGQQPLANNLFRAEDLLKSEPRFPLRLAVCEACWLMQIVDLVPPVELFSDYLYFSSFSDSMLRHARLAAERYVDEFQLGGRSHVIEVASNDGYLLQNFSRLGVPCLGIEPAANVAKVAQKRGIETLVEFFTPELAKKLSNGGRKADLILGNNVFAHVPDVNGFIEGLGTLLKKEGRIVLEFPYGIEFIEKTEFDTIYHEHVYYFTLTALRPLLAKHGLEIFHVERLPIHGGSLRLFAGHRGVHDVQPTVDGMLADENGAGVADIAFYHRFAERVGALRTVLVSLVRDLRAAGRSVAAYGASAKGSTLLNYFGLGRESLDFVVDRSTYKQGRFTPGSQLPILPAEELVARQPDYTLLLTWNFAEEILAQQAEYRTAGGRFILPVPQVTVV
jgi:SAM-dependent methyltransferase